MNRSKENAAKKKSTKTEFQKGWDFCCLPRKLWRRAVVRHTNGKRNVTYLSLMHRSSTRINFKVPWHRVFASFTRRNASDRGPMLHGVIIRLRLLYLASYARTARSLMTDRQSVPFILILFSVFRLEAVDDDDYYDYSVSQSVSQSTNVFCAFAHHQSRCARSSSSFSDFRLDFLYPRATVNMHNCWSGMLRFVKIEFSRGRIRRWEICATVQQHSFSVGIFLNTHNVRPHEIIII